MNFSEKTQRCQYVEALEEERRKIRVFQRELPLCLDLVTQAIEAYRRELSGTTTEHVQGHSDCSEQTSSEVPVLEEFIPIKRTEEKGDDRSSSKRSKDKDHKRKSDWLRSTQLWNQSPDPSPPTHKEEIPRKAVVTEVKRNGTGGAFQPFQREKAAPPSCSAAVPASATSSSAETVASGEGTRRKEDKDADGQRKQRRCWSPELHRRFLHALQQLGGSHAATPKQIRELMKVDGLTNDEVKSHLQKYRLHTRRPSPAIHNSSNPQAPQFVVVGGIWVPPSEFAATATASKGIYEPVASTPSLPSPPSATTTSAVANKAEQLRVQVSEGEGSETEGGHELSHSPATSSSTHTTTTSSPGY